MFCGIECIFGVRHALVTFVMAGKLASGLPGVIFLLAVGCCERKPCIPPELRGIQFRLVHSLDHTMSV